MFQPSADPRHLYGVNPAHITLNYPYDVFKSTHIFHHYPNDFTRSLMHLNEGSRMADDLSGPRIPTPIFSDHSAFPPMSGVPNVASRPRIVKRKCSTQDVSGRKTVKKETRSIAPATPILDAHRGITQAELEAKAFRYRQRNPGEDLDKQWLASFSGKLSAEGEMIHDFRCYVVGCTQVNKRRDHMVVHIGSHLNQKNFKCDRW
ncbi:hypothetical protein B0H16DRAFT_1498674 [Mycena metata]|uniref:Uncharacterized protein n=1 Tax=Mycena metata TaxID=1033252 RepID=A0AAD7KC56_9AGAR|nr:hypothetical protein B0H16DRAFT_1498674 [Mycena metata]